MTNASVASHPPQSNSKLFMTKRRFSRVRNAMLMGKDLAAWLIRFFAAVKAKIAFSVGRTAAVIKCCCIEESLLSTQRMKRLRSVVFSFFRPFACEIRRRTNKPLLEERRPTVDQRHKACLHRKSTSQNEWRILRPSLVRSFQRLSSLWRVERVSLVEPKSQLTEEIICEARVNIPFRLLVKSNFRLFRRLKYVFEGRTTPHGVRVDVKTARVDSASQS